MVIPAEIQNRHLANTTTALLLEPTSTAVSRWGSGISNDPLYPEVQQTWYSSSRLHSVNQDCYL